MIELLKDGFKALYRVLTHRLLWLFILLGFLFYLLIARLFELQIVLADNYKAAPPRTMEVSVPVQALRGSIYDSQGRPLAVNKLVYVVKMDPSISITNEALYELVKVFERNGEKYVDDFPMTKEEPYAFTFPENDWQDWYEFRWKDDMTVENPETATAQESFEFLRKQFKIDPALSNAEVRKILNFRCMIYMERMIVMESYDPSPITLAYDVKPETVAAIEEGNALFTGVYIEIQSLREYPQGPYFSHMLGYIRKISETELENNKDKGYTSQDLIGKAGLERSMEGNLRGVNGSQTLEVDSRGRRSDTPVEVTEPEPGDRVFLTLDSYLQQKAYDILEDMLCRELAAKITERNARENSITMKQLFTSLVKSNNLPVKRVLEAPEGTDAYTLRKYIFDRFPEANPALTEDMEKIKGILTDGLDAGRVTPAMVLLTMVDMGQITDPDGKLAVRIKSGNAGLQQVVVEKILAKELTPQMVNLDPSSGSVVVVDVNNGDVLAAASYPSYDNNRLVNNFDNEYYYQINQNDPTNPMVYRPFMEPRAPGSTFKMITAAAALEAGVITPSTTVMDEHSFTRAGKPYADCWSSASHGRVNVAQALQVSCNFFFCEVAYRLGNARNNTTTNGIATLNDYMVYFGLNDKTGVEIGELYNMYDSNPDLLYKISSPEFKEYTEKSRDAFVSKSQWDWYDGDTVRTAIGQGFNNYTPAMMARYISVIANRGVRYPLHLVDKVENYKGETVMQYVAVPDALEMTISDKTWDNIIEGMRLVTEGTGVRSGTGVSDFKGFPIRVAGKTGTAQQSTSRPDHSSFAGFAPYEDPQIAVYVSVPFGDSRLFTHVSARIAREIIGEALGLSAEPEYPEAINAIRP